MKTNGIFPYILRRFSNFSKLFNLRTYLSPISSCPHFKALPSLGQKHVCISPNHFDLNENNLYRVDHKK